MTRALLAALALLLAGCGSRPLVCPDEAENAVIREMADVWVKGGMNTSDQIAKLRTWALTIPDLCERKAWLDGLAGRLVEVSRREKAAEYRKAHPRNAPPAVKP